MKAAVAGALLVLSAPALAQPPCAAGFAVRTIEFWPLTGTGCSRPDNGGFVLEGPWTFHDRDGELAARGTFRAGSTRDQAPPLFGGQSASLPVQGREGRWQEWQGKDRLTFDGVYRAGRLHGHAKGFLRSGLPREEATFTDGELDGLWTRWFDDGLKEQEVPVRRGRFHGVLQVWFPGGARRLEERYVDGAAHGPSTRWHPNGQRAEAGQYVRARPAGTWTEWCEDGRVKATTVHPAGGGDGARTAGPCDTGGATQGTTGAPTP